MPFSGLTVSSINQVPEITKTNVGEEATPVGVGYNMSDTIISNYVARSG